MIKHGEGRYPRGSWGVYSLTNTMAIEIVVLNDEELKYMDINGEWKEAKIVYDLVEEYLEDGYSDEDAMQAGFYWGKTFIPLCEVIKI